MTKDLPSPELLRKLLRYEPKTGKLFWLPRKNDKSWTKRWAGKEAGSFSSRYVKIDVMGKSILGHRVAWAIYFGSWPNDDIDHKNGDTHDNRISNLRDVTKSINQRNSKMRADNTSGHAGIRMSLRPAKWRAEIKVSGKTKHLGYFDTLDEAIAARKKAKSKNGFSDRHGAYS